MKKLEIVNFSNFISGLKLNKFNKEMRSAIISNSLIASKIAKEFNENVEEAKKQFISGKEEEVEKLNAYRASYNTSSAEERQEIIEKIKSECMEALAVEQEIITFINKFSNENVEASFVPINMIDFIDACADADIDVTPAQLMSFNSIFVE